MARVHPSLPTTSTGSPLSQLSEQAPEVLPGSTLSPAEPRSSQRLETYRRWQMATIALPLFDRVKHVVVTNAEQNEDGVVYYHIDVFLAEQARKNLYSQRRQAVEATTDNTNPPAYHLERRYSDFDRLRTDLLSRIPSCQCPYCLDLAVYLRIHWEQPNAIHKVLCTSSESRRKMLESFLNDVVALAQAPVLKLYHRVGSTCGARERVQAMLSGFLLE